MYSHSACFPVVVFPRFFRTVCMWDGWCGCWGCTCAMVVHMRGCTSGWHCTTPPRHTQPPGDAWKLPPCLHTPSSSPVLASYSSTSSDPSEGRADKSDKTQGVVSHAAHQHEHAKLPLHSFAIVCGGANRDCGHLQMLCALCAGPATQWP